MRHWQLQPPPPINSPVEAPPWKGNPSRGSYHKKRQGCTNMPVSPSLWKIQKWLPSALSVLLEEELSASPFSLLLLCEEALLGRHATNQKEQGVKLLQGVPPPPNHRWNKAVMHIPLGVLYGAQGRCPSACAFVMPLPVSWGQVAFFCSRDQGFFFLVLVLLLTFQYVA